MRHYICFIVMLVSTNLNAKDLYLGNFEETGEKLESVYFDTDKANIKPSEQPKIELNAKVIKEQKLKVIVIGNADSRGDRSYNIELGARRALSVSLELMNQGVEQKQIILVSYGEELPVSKELKSNRRVDTVSIRAVREVVKIQNKNRVMVHGGVGPNGLKNLILTQTHAKFEQKYGPVFGLGYSRLVTETWSVGITGFSNKSGFLNIGFDF